MKNLLSDLFDIGKKKSKSQIPHEFLENGINECSIFHKLIEMERFRVHRDNRQFSLILFNVNHHPDKVPSIDTLVSKISKKVRQIDRVGWFDNHHIGVLLPNTTATGAKIVARMITNEICGNHLGAQNCFPFETFSYPDSIELAQRK